MTARSLKPKVTVYVPCRAYGRYLSQALESVLAQTMHDWELLIVDDGSEDETSRIARRYEAAHPDRLRVLRHPSPRGLQACANTALQAAQGELILRLDADDYLDENALLVLSAYLDAHPDVALVFPNYIYVDEAGSVLGLEQRKRVGQEAHLLDLPAHGACAMVRKRILKSVGGYDERYDRQDGYELWLKVVNRYPVANVSTPLFYYRQHPRSLAQDEQQALATRRRIKDDRVGREQGSVQPRVVAVVQAKNTYAMLPDIVLQEVAGLPLIDYTLEAAGLAGVCETVVVTTDDERVVAHCRARPGVWPVLRPSALSADRVLESAVVEDAVTRLEQEQGLHPDIIVVLSVHSPLRRPEHIREAVNTLVLYNADSVVSVYEDYDLHYLHGPQGLTPLNPAMHRQVRVERESLFVSNGAIRALWRDVLSRDDIVGRKVGHIVMSRQDSYQIKTPHDLWLVTQLLQQRRQEPERRLQPQPVHQEEGA